MPTPAQRSLLSTSLLVLLSGCGAGSGTKSKPESKPVEAKAGQEGSFAISPASIHVALTMTWAGAKGNTRSEMGDVLHLGGLGDDEQVAAVAGGQLAPAGWAYLGALILARSGSGNV